MRWINLSGLLVAVGMLLGCYSKGDPGKPIPTSLAAAPGKATRLVVVLPGRGDDVAALRRSGMVEAIQAAWPDADVVLTGLALGYYMEGRAAQRLHEEVIVPAKRRGYREVWLAGASMGGMGALMYDRLYPGEADGLVLLAPYLGERPLLDEIASAGGVAGWNAGAVPASVDAQNYQRELWRHLQGWSRDPAKAGNVWLAYGDEDRLRDAMPLLTPLLRADHVLVREGGHAWTVWSPATRDILAREQASR
jgi:pimeloyl-ACP methyl ester carboxylesterase